MRILNFLVNVITVFVMTGKILISLEIYPIPMYTWFRPIWDLHMLKCWEQFFFPRLSWLPGLCTSKKTHGTFSVLVSMILYLLIEIHCLCIDWEIKRHGSRVNFVNLCHFIFQSIQRSVRDITPKKSKNVNFPVKWPVAFIGEYLTQFSYASTQATAMGMLILIVNR